MTIRPSSAHIVGDQQTYPAGPVQTIGPAFVDDGLDVGGVADRANTWTGVVVGARTLIGGRTSGAHFPASRRRVAFLDRAFLDKVYELHSRRLRRGAECMLLYT